LGTANNRLSIDSNGRKTYTIDYLIGAAVSDNVYAVKATTGLPRAGDPLNFGGDVDATMLCTAQSEISQEQKKGNEKSPLWKVTKTFIDTNPRITGNSVKQKEEAATDRFGDPVFTSSHEHIRGPQNEWDVDDNQVVIEQWITDLQLSLLSQMSSSVNKYPLWNHPPRTIKLSDYKYDIVYDETASGGRKLYHRVLTFDIRYRRELGVDSTFEPGTGTHVDLIEVIAGKYINWDRDILDEGTKVLKGHWDSSGAWVLDPLSSLGPPSRVGTVVSPTGGSLLVGPYSYRVASLDSTGGESAASSEIQALPGVPGMPFPTNKITLTWTAVSGETGGYRIYSRIEGDTTYTHVADVATGVLTYIDTGTFISDGKTPLEVGTSTGQVWPDPDNPRHFIRFKDFNGENARVILDGEGKPTGVWVRGPDEGTGTGTEHDLATSPGMIHVERYGESDMRLLGIPESW